MSRPTDRNQQNKRPSRRSFLKKALLVGLPAIGLDAFAVEPHWVSVDTVTLPVRDLPDNFEGYKVLHLTDTHCGAWIDPEMIRTVIHQSLQLKPDLVVFTGDVVDGNGPHALPSLVRPFEKVNAPDGALLVLGNHDAWKGGVRVRRAVRDETPFECIENEHRIIERDGQQLAIVGLGDLWTGHLEFDKAFKGIDPKTPRILLQHNPDLAEEMPSGFRVDMQLSGHTHGGQIRMPWGYAPRVPSRYGNKFLEGLIQGSKHKVFVTRGIGAVGPYHPRLFCRPQICLLKLAKAAQ